MIVNYEEYCLIVERIELHLRTQLAYYCGHVYGSLGYMDKSIYNKKHNHDKFRKLLNDCIEENKKSLVVKHHKENMMENFRYG